MAEEEALVPTPWRTFRTAAWLGWQVESNWARPWVFAIYTVLKPLALAGILVVMYAVISPNGFGSPTFAYMYIGNAFYIYVGAVMSGMGWAVVEDRERYRTLKSMYVAPMDIRLYLVGRGGARFLTASVSVLLTVALGVLILGVPVTLRTIDWPLLTIALAAGVVVLGLMGLLLAGLMLLAGDEAWGLGEMLAGALYLFSGAIFPLTVLPGLLRPIGLAMPLTYWLALVRRALVGPGPAPIPALAAWSDARLCTALLALTAVLAIVALVGFRLCEARARNHGIINRTSNY